MQVVEVPMALYDVPCMGALITMNNYTDNFGCPMYGGSLIEMQCVEDL
jgi:hypothetical protein